MLANAAGWSDRTHRELTDDDIARIAGTYHSWRQSPDAAGDYVKTFPGFCGSASAGRRWRRHGHVLTPGRYVGAEAQPEDDGEPFEERDAAGSSQSWQVQQR